MKIEIFNHQKDLPLSKKQLKLIVREVLSFFKVQTDQVALYFVTEKKISKLHEEFFQDPSPTDCISFPLDKNFLGEVFICPKVGVLYAKKKGLDPFQETVLYVVHGLLHLLGFDDLEPKAKRIMRKKEKSCMAYLDKIQLI